MKETTKIEKIRNPDITKFKQRITGEKNRRKNEMISTFMSKLLQEPLTA